MKPSTAATPRCPSIAPYRCAGGPSAFRLSRRCSPGARPGRAVGGLEVGGVVEPVQQPGVAAAGTDPLGHRRVDQVVGVAAGGQPEEPQRGRQDHAAVGHGQDGAAVVVGAQPLDRRPAPARGTCGPTRRPATWAGRGRGRGRAARSGRRSSSQVRPSASPGWRSHRSQSWVVAAGSRPSQRVSTVGRLDGTGQHAGHGDVGAEAGGRQPGAQGLGLARPGGGQPDAAPVAGDDPGLDGPGVAVADQEERVGGPTGPADGSTGGGVGTVAGSVSRAGIGAAAGRRGGHGRRAGRAGEGRPCLSHPLRSLAAMPLDLVTTAYGRPALRALGDAVAAAKGADLLAPVTVVVPSNHVGVAARRLLAAGSAVTPAARARPAARGRGLVGVTFLTPYRLAELLGANRLAAAGRRPVSTPVVRGRAAPGAGRRAGRVRPGRRAPRHRGGAGGGLRPAGRPVRRRAGGPGRRRAAGGRRRAAVPPGPRPPVGAWYDEADLADAAVEATMAGDPVLARRRPRGHPPRAGADPSTRPGSCGRWPTAGPRTVVAARPARPRPTPACAGRSTASGARAWHRRRRPAGEPSGARAAGAWPAGASGPSGRGRRRRVAGGGGAHPAADASDADDEVRAAVRAVVDAARRGTPLERIAVLYGSVEPYGRLLHEHLAAAGVPRNGTAVRPLGASAVGRVGDRPAGAARPRVPAGRRDGAAGPHRRPHAGRAPSRRPASGSACPARRASSPAAPTGTRGSPRLAAALDQRADDLGARPRAAGAGRRAGRRPARR